MESISSAFYARNSCTKFWRQKISNPKHSFVIFGAKILYKKCMRKTLMKLTQGLKFDILDFYNKQNGELAKSVRDFE